MQQTTNSPAANPVGHIITRDHLLRQTSLIDSQRLESLPVHIIGCGAIGSFAAQALAKMGFIDFHLYDMDKVSIENMNCQAFGKSQINLDKTMALAGQLNQFLFDENCPDKKPSIKINGEITEKNLPALTGVVILSVDSLPVRMMLAKFIRKSCLNVKFIIDPRMGAEYYFQQSFDMDSFQDKKTFENYLASYPKLEDVVEAKCTAKSTVYTAMLSAGLIAKTVKNWVMGQPYPKHIDWDIAGCGEPVIITSKVLQ